MRETAAEKNDQFAWLRNLVVLAAVRSAAGCLFGYGVAMGLSSRFGLGTGVWYSSTLELDFPVGRGLSGPVFDDRVAMGSAGQHALGYLSPNECEWQLAQQAA